jgi:hypothetical protein
MSSSNTQCFDFTASILSLVARNQNQHADEIFDLQRIISEQQDRILELERRNDPMLTATRAAEIARELGFAGTKVTRPGTSNEYVAIWHKYTRGDKTLKKQVTVNAHPGRRDTVRAAGCQSVWLGTHVKDQNLFTDLRIPIGSFGPHDRYEDISDRKGGKIFTSDTVYESTFRKVLHELTK